MRQFGVGEAISGCHGSADAQVAEGEDVGADQDEHEEHFGGPHADAVDGGEGGDDLVVGHGGEFLEGQAAIDEVLGEVAKVGDLLAGEAHGAELGVGEFEDEGRGGAAVGEEGAEAGEDGGGGGGGDLLAEDGLAEGGEGRAREDAERGVEARADLGDEEPHDGVGGGEVGLGAGPVGRGFGVGSPHGGIVVRQ